MQQGIGEAWARHPTYGGPHHPRLMRPPIPRGTGRAAALKENALRNTFPRARVDAAIERFFARRMRGPARSEGANPWPLSLRVFRAALQQALRTQGEEISVGRYHTRVRATDIAHARDAFFAAYAAVAASEEERDAERAAAFKRATAAAQRQRLIGALERDGVQWVWPIA
jgi:hypothetical protein